jgi:hypothetical protein
MGQVPSGDARRSRDLHIHPRQWVLIGLPDSGVPTYRNHCSNRHIEFSAGQCALDVLGRFLGLWRALLDSSRLRTGCAIVSVTVAGPDAEVLDHVGAIFRSWTDQLAELFVAGGMAEDVAHRMATVTIAATEGAVVISRAQRSRDPFDDVANTLSVWFETCMDTSQKSHERVMESTALGSKLSRGARPLGAHGMIRRQKARHHADLPVLDPGRNAQR